jgi:hypothetical protein
MRCRYARMVGWESRGVRPILAAIAACAAIFAVSTAGSAARSATSSGRTAAACPNETVDAGQPVGKLRLRFELIGPVTCAKAHRLARTYFHRFATGKCGALNNFCVLSLPGGWSCSIFPAGESQQAGGAMAGCANARTGAKVRLFKARRHTKGNRGRAEAAFYSPSRNISCEMTDDPRLPKPHVYCQSMKRPHSVLMDSAGRLKICRASGTTPMCLGNPGEHTPVLHYGKHIRVGRFRCMSKRIGVTCVVIKTGSGFLINRERVRRIGA